MANPVDRLNDFIAESGAGVDAAGRVGFAGYQSPQEHINNKIRLAKHRAEAAKFDPQGELIRNLLDQMMMRNLPGSVRLQLPAPHGPSTVNYSVQEGK